MTPPTRMLTAFMIVPPELRSAHGIAAGAVAASLSGLSPRWHGLRSPAILPDPTRRASHGNHDVQRLCAGMPAVARWPQDCAAEGRGTRHSPKMGYHRSAEPAALSRHVPARTAGAAGLHSFMRRRPGRRD